MRLQIQRDNVPKLVNIFANSGRELTRGFFANMYGNEIMSRVVSTPCKTGGYQCCDPDLPIWSKWLRAEMRGSFDQYGITMLRAFAVVNEPIWKNYRHSDSKQRS